MKKIIICLCLVFTVSLSILPTTYSAEISITAEEFAQRVDGSTVTLPLTQALADTLYDQEAPTIVHNKTSEAIHNVITGDKDIVFVTYPSEKEFADAKAAGVELECVPVVKDAFVFLGNALNPVTGLTQRQIKDIYSGKVTGGWFELFGTPLFSHINGAFGEISAFQRNEGSGSQSGMLEFMGDEKITIPENDRMFIVAMGILVDGIASCMNSIGYSYYYFAENQNEYYERRDEVKYFSVDGVMPSNDSIRDGTYPLVTSYYAVIRKDSPKDSFARDLLEYVLSDEGQAIAETAGYVGMPKEIDLSVSAAKPTAAILNHGDSTKYTCTIRNSGEAATKGNIKVEFYKNNILVDTVYITDSIPAGGSKVVVSNLSARESFGLNSLKVIINLDNNIKEKNYSNNNIKTRYPVKDD